MGVLFENDIPSIVMEWAPDGSLYDYIVNYDGRYDNLEIVSVTDCHHSIKPTKLFTGTWDSERTWVFAQQQYCTWRS